MAFVFVQHLARDHKSILSELVRRYTRMEVFEVEDGMVVKPNCAYIIPPNRDMALVNGALQLLEPTLARGIRLPIDFFFRSLAQDQHDRAICIVLSGTGSDGALGSQGGKGRGRHGNGADSRIHRVRRHAPQRHRHRHGGFCAVSTRDARQASRLCRACVWNFPFSLLAGSTAA